MKFILVLLFVSCASTKSPDVILPTTPEIIIANDISNSELKLFTAREYDLNNYSWLKPSIDCAHKVINSDLFRNKITAIERFDYAPTTVNGKSVLDRLNTAKTVSVRTYYKRFGSAIAYTYYDAAEIYLNTKWKRPIPEIVNTLVHESTHTVGYSHGDNYAAGKENSVPYKLGDFAELVAKELCK